MCTTEKTHQMTISVTNDHQNTQTVFHHVHSTTPLVNASLGPQTPLRPSGTSLGLQMSVVT